MEKKLLSGPLFKRAMSLALALVMLLGMLPAPQARAAGDGTTVYLKPNGNWLMDGARFALYYFGDSGDGWGSMSDSDGDGYHEGSVPAGYGNVIFCRMNPGSSENNWDNKWNQTSDLTVPTNGDNCYTVADGAWDKGSGSWSVYTPKSEEPETSEPETSEPETSEPETSEPVQEDKAYYVAGDSALCGVNWSCDAASNKMSKNAAGLYEKVYANVPAGTYNLKVTDGTWNNSWGDGSQNYTFVVSAVCDVTVTFDPSSHTVKVTGANVGRENGLEITSMVAVGGGSGSWLNGEIWVVNSTANAMKEVSDNVYEITFKGVTAGNYEFKFAANGSWTHSWGSGGAAGEAVYNGQNIKLSIDYALADVTLRLDMTGYDHSTKNGAVYTVTVTEAVAEPETEYYLIGYINGADYGCNDDYANLGEYKFVDGRLTASFTSDSYVFLKTGDNANWFMTQAYAGASPATFHNTTTGASEKLFVPGGVELAFTLEENEDGTLTLSYAEVADTNDVLIHFFKPDTWGTGINAYLWTTSGAIAGYEAHNQWPGKAISANEQHAGWYDVTVSTAEPMDFNFIFNDGANQTADLYTGTVTGDTELWVVGNDVSATAPGEWSGDYDYTAHLHFKKPADWADTIYAWIWDDAGKIPGYEDYNTDWPGKAVEADAINAGWYNVSVTMDENAGFNYIFSDGNGKQTADLVTGTLDVTTHLWIVDGAASTTAPEGWMDPSRTIHVPGTFPGPSWDAASNQMSYDASLGLYVYTFEDVPPANYEYKIAVNGSWNENYGAAGVKDGANIAVAVTETTDVTVYYNDKTHNSVTSVSYIFADVTLSGTGIPEGTKLTDNGLTGIYSVTVPMTAGIYTDLKITCDGKEYAFAEIEIEEDKAVTFFMDPVTEIYYCDASDIPINAAAVYFDSRNEEYKKPFGSAAVGEEVAFAIDTGADVTSAVLVVKGLGSYPMTAEETESGLRWSCTATFAAIGEYDYYFSLSNGSTVVIFSDDDGYYGEGVVTDLTDVKPYDLVVHEADFQTPDWMKDAVIYQIFPDRFFDGDISNNQTQTWARGSVNYEYINDWYTLPENPEQKELLDEATYKATGAHFGDGEWSNEIYGGDLDGITQRIDYLKALGVNVIYLNPIFWSISNHRYDAVDYTEIDPILGTMGDFKELVAVAEANDMHIILDGVFNHVSDDSVYFDRYYKFLPDAAELYDGKIGAYPYWAYVYDYMAEQGAGQADAEAAAKAYFSEEYGITDYSYTEWFEVYNRSSGSVDSMGLREGKEVYAYDGWWGYDSMPIIYSTNGSEYQTGNWAQEIIHNAEGTSVTQYWIAKGNNGWRLDVANEVSDETWQRFRDSVKALDSDAVIIGEIWDDATKYLKGDMYDSVMNYQFRNAVTSFAMGTGAEDTTKTMEKIRERYPEEAFYAMMNLVGSHDTTRILSYLDGIGDDRADKTLNAAFPTYAKTSAAAKARQYLVAFLQFTYAGAPTIYYGDEIGMVGSDDPDDRRAMEWGKGNRELVEWYAKLAAIREAYPALRTGDVQPVDLENSNLLAFVRSDDANTLTVIANNSASAQTAVLEGSYVDLISGGTFDGTVPARSGVILVAADEVKSVSVNYAGLAPAYDDSYIVAVRPEGVHVHSYQAVVTAPTCTEEGYTTFTCIDPECGDSYVSKEVPALGHSWDEGTVTAPTCTEAGFTTYTCTVCGETEDRDPVDALGHDWDEGNLTREPSAQQPGEVTYACSRCSETYTRELAIVLSDGIGTTLFSGKSQTLKATDLCTNKTVPTSKIQWTLAEEYAPYATLSASGKLTARKIFERQQIVVIGKLKNNDKALEIVHTVTIYPALTKVEVVSGDAIVNGKTVPMDFTQESMTFRVDTYPLDTSESVTWSVSDAKNRAYAKYAMVNDTLTISELTGKAGTITVKATVDAGVKKTVTFKVQFASFAKTVEIRNTETQLRAGDKALTLKAEITDPDVVTKSGIVWSLKDSADKAYVNLTSGGKLTAKTVYGEHDVTIVATSKDGKASDDFTIKILPKKDDILILSDESGKNVTKTTIAADLNDPEAVVTLKASNLDGTGAGKITWTPAKTSKSAEVTIDGSTITIKPLKAGSVTVTAKAPDKRSATVTIKASKLADKVQITSEKGFEVASGKSLTLKATVEKASSSKVVWSIVSGDAYAKISSSGKLTAAKDLTTMQEVLVRATAADGSGEKAEQKIIIRPLAQGVQISSVDEATGMMLLSVDSAETEGIFGTVRSNTTLVWDMEQDDTMKLDAKVYPFYKNDARKNAIQNVDWKSSNTKVATVDKAGNVKMLKAGTTTITATASDGSSKKVSFKLTVVKRMTSLVLPETAFIASGKKLTLKPVIGPEDTTNKKLAWSVTGDSRVRISDKGVLTTPGKLTEIVTVTVTCKALDGSGLEDSCVVSIHPATKKVTIWVEQDDQQRELTGQKQAIPCGPGAEFSCKIKTEPEKAAGQYTWKSSNEKYAFVDQNGNVTVFDAVGKTVTITATAADGTGVNGSFKIKIMNPTVQ